MIILNAISLAPDVNVWLANSHHPRILHVFDHACNLINERGEILSMVTQHIGNGPFNLVLNDDLRFIDYLDIESFVTIQDAQLRLGDLTVSTANANLWHPRPNWELLHAKQDHILHQLTQLQTANLLSHQSPISQFSNSLVSSLAHKDLLSAIETAKHLSGLGIGLTPAGDDFILGALLAVWVIHPFETASVLASEVAETAALLTTSLSAAWLRSTGKGEAGILWHEFFDALIAVGRTLAPGTHLPRAQVPGSAGVGNLTYAMEKILAVGATSGADTLAGFIGTLLYVEREKDHVIPTLI